MPNEPRVSRVAFGALEEARQQVEGPAMGLTIASLLTLVCLTGVLIVWTDAAVLSVTGKTSGLPWLYVIPLVLLMMGCNIVALVGARRMKQLRSYDLALIGSGLAAIPGFGLALPFGIWALLVLNRREVREAFGQARGPSAPGTLQPGHGGGAWKAVLAVAVMVLCGLTLAFVMRAQRPRELGTGLADVSPDRRYPPARGFSSLTTNNLSVVVFHENNDGLLFALFHAGIIKSHLQAGSQGGDVDLQEGSIALPNGELFVPRWESSKPEQLQMNGRDFDLRSGRVLVLRDDGTVEQLSLFPPLAVARNLEQLSRLIAARQRARGKA